jgi:hypothetical protein
VINGEVFVVFVEKLVARPDHECRPQLHRTSTCVVLSIPTAGGPCPGDDLLRLEERHHPQRLGPDYLSGAAVLVQEHLEWHRLVLDERLGVSLATRSDRRHTCAGVEDVLISLADLTGPLSTSQSAEVTEKQDDTWALGPSVAQTMLGFIGIDEDLLSELIYIERHDLPRNQRVTPSIPYSSR